MIIEDFSDGDAVSWSYVSDRVMGGVSDGTARLVTEDGVVFARLEGQVSTENNGGFIQIRRSLAEAIDPETKGLKIRLRGNGARYYVHLRPRAARRPWQYFQANFETTGDWQDIMLPWSAFKPEGGLPNAFDPAEVISLGVVAYGADFAAQLDIAWVKVE